MFTLTFQSNDLQSAMSVLRKVINGKGAMPILERIVFAYDEEKGHLRLTASDGTTTFIHTSIPCDADGEGIESIAILPNWLDGMLSNNDGTATIHLSVEKGKADYTITAKTCDTCIGGFAVGTKGYPNYKPTGATTFSYEYNYKAFISAVKSVMYACDKDGDIRPQMAGVYVDDQEDGKTNFVATDGRIMTSKSAKVKSDDSKAYSVTIGKSLIGILSALTADSLEIVQHYTTKEQEGETKLTETEYIEINAGAYWIQTQRVEGRYPNYKSVMLNTDNSFVATTSRASLISAVKRASNYGNSASGLFCMNVKDGEIEVTSRDYDSATDVREALPAFTSIDAPTAIGACSVYALKILNSIGGGNVTIYFVSTDRPLVLIGSDESLYTLLMPMALEEDPNKAPEPVEQKAEEPAEDIEENETEEHEEDVEAGEFESDTNE